MPKLICLFLGLSLLAGCSNDSDSGHAPASANGLYFGHTADGGSSAAFLVLDGGVYYEWHYDSAGIYGGAAGVGSYDAGTFTTTQAAIANAPAQLSAAVTGSSFDGTLTFSASAQSPSFSFTAAPSSSFHTAARLDAVQGAWATPVITDSQDYGLEGQTVTIDAQGNVTAANPLGCTGQGTLAPDPSGLGYFDFSLTYQGGDCIFGTQTLTGVAVLDPSGPQLLTSIVTSDRSDGIVSSGFRSDGGT